jgi:hypothetical protein
MFLLIRIKIQQAITLLAAVFRLFAPVEDYIADACSSQGMTRGRHIKMLDNLVCWARYSGTFYASCIAATFGAKFPA